MNEQFIDRVINILIEQHKLRPDNLGGRGQSGGQLKDPASRARAAKTLRLKRGLDKVGAPKAPTMKEESTVLDRVIKILAEMKLGEAKYEKNMGTREKMEIRDKRFAADNPHPRHEPHENTFARRERKHVNTHGTWGHGHVKNRVRARTKQAEAGREDSSTQLIKNKIVEMFSKKSYKSNDGGIKLGGKGSPVKPKPTNVTSNPFKIDPKFIYKKPSNLIRKK